MVGKKLGGKVQMNVEANIFRNACPIRMSYVLNKTGHPISSNMGYAAVSGSDKRFYLYRVKDMLDYLNRTFGKPDKTAQSPKLQDFAGMKGILLVKGHGWGDASGHVTLWDGTKCSDTCHLMYDPENGVFVPETAYLWVLQ
ncbi:cytoplasmic protein [Caldimonas brevitalea]|uniref:Cytoplasmic protein n=2 Tax=Caldimonas brevitalea TaxID=413882 RepID=A0A0G3BRD0_9BURK|nr:cytoplasmic protein [Caldimonas brevitalea]